jgi:predicted transcriptional regulator
MNTNWSPLQIKLLLKIHTTQTLKPNDIPSEIHRNELKYFITNGLVEKVEGINHTYALTDKGVAFIEMLLNTPLPELKWIDPRK